MSRGGGTVSEQSANLREGQVSQPQATELLNVSEHTENTAKKVLIPGVEPLQKKLSLAQYLFSLHLRNGCNILNSGELKLYLSTKIIGVCYSHSQLRDIMKFITVVLLAIVTASCASSRSYIEPTESNVATVYVEPIRVVDGEKFMPRILVFLDNALVNRTDKAVLFPVSKFKVTPGKHKLKLDITAYNGLRAKFKKLVLDLSFLESTTYKLDIKIPDKFEGEINDDSFADIMLTNTISETVSYQKRVVLSDNGGRSVSGLNYYEDVALPTVIGL